MAEATVFAFSVLKGGLEDFFFTVVKIFSFFFYASLLVRDWAGLKLGVDPFCKSAGI